MLDELSSISISMLFLITGLCSSFRILQSSVRFFIFCCGGRMQGKLLQGIDFENSGLMMLVLDKDIVDT
jgi:hypothetical protein